MNLYIVMEYCSRGEMFSRGAWRGRAVPGRARAVDLSRVPAFSGRPGRGRGGRARVDAAVLARHRVHPRVRLRAPRRVAGERAHHRRGRVQGVRLRAGDAAAAALPRVPRGQEGIHGAGGLRRPAPLRRAVLRHVVPRHVALHPAHGGTWPPQRARPTAAASGHRPHASTSRRRAPTSQFAPYESPSDMDERFQCVAALPREAASGRPHALAPDSPRPPALTRDVRADRSSAGT